MQSKQILSFIVAVGVGVFVVGCGSGSNPSPTSQALPTPKSVPATIEEVAEPMMGDFFGGQRAGVRLRVADNTVAANVVSGEQDFLAPHGWQFDTDWTIPYNAITLSARVGTAVVSPPNGGNTVRLLTRADGNLAPGTVLTTGIYWLLTDGFNPLINRATGSVWEMRGGQMMVEANGAGDRPEV